MSLDFLNDVYLGADVSLDDVRAGRAVLKRGSKGDAVTYVQALAGAISDGDFGPGTETAVKKFQSANGLTADGIVGAQTLAALDKLASGGTAGVERVDFTAPAASPAPAKVATPTSSKSAPVPRAEVLAEKTEAFKSPLPTYTAYGLGGVAVLGIGLSLLMGKKKRR